MFRLSKQVEYALMALSDLSESGSSVAVSDIAQKRGISKNSLSKVMQNLQLGELIKSKQGIAGGYEVAANLKEVSLYDILVLFGEIKKLGCSEDNSKCLISENCNIKTPLKVWESEFEKFLKSTPVSQFTQSQFKLVGNEL